MDAFAKPVRGLANTIPVEERVGEVKADGVVVAHAVAADATSGAELALLLEVHEVAVVSLVEHAALVGEAVLLHVAVEEGGDCERGRTCVGASEVCLCMRMRDTGARRLRVAEPPHMRRNR